ncbi:CHAT domain-containing protein [candidate division KSB1 bacterium]|nr:CHAT domain-containing protein [candidate division KSB1 bacterium]
MQNRPIYFLLLTVTALGLVCLIPTSELWSQLPDHLRERYKTALRMMGEENYQEAIPELQRLIQEDPQLSNAYRSLAEAYIYQGDFEAAKDYFESLRQKNSQNAYLYYALGRIAFAQNNLNSAITKLKKAIELQPDYAEPYGLRGGLPEIYNAMKDLDTGAQYFRGLIEADPKNACSYYGLARIHIKKYELQEALNMLSKAVELDPELTLAHQSMIFLLFRLSRYDDVLERSKMLLQLANRVDDFAASAYAEYMIGNTHFVRGDYSKALSWLQDAFSHAKETGNIKRQSTVVNTMAAIYALSANFPKALQYFNESLILTQKSGHKMAEVQALGNIANVYKDQGDQEQALVYYQKALLSAQENNFKHGESVNLSNMAEIYQQRKDFSKAIQYQKRALELATEIGERTLQAYILRNFGTLNQDLGKDAEAIDYLRRALAIGVETRDVQIIWESQAGLGSCYEQQNKPDLAIKHYKHAIALYDSVRNSLDIESLQTSFLEDKYEAYPSIIQLLARSGKLEAAFAYAEKYKAKSLLDLLSKGRNLFNPLLSDSLRVELQEILGQNEEAHQALLLELAKPHKDQSKMLSLDQKITDLELKRVTLIENLRTRHGPFYQLAAPEILELKEVQRRILQNDQALLEYILGSDRLGIFVVTPDTVAYSEVPLSREQLKSMLTHLSPIFGSERDKQFLNAELADFSIPPAHALYQLLIKPIWSHIADTKRLIIVPDDLLYYLPFELLVYDTTGVETPYDFKNAKFLLEQFEISYMSSASLLDPRLQAPRKPTKVLLALGNPDFDTPKRSEPELLASKEPVTKNVARGDFLPSLPNAESEVKAIGAETGGSNNSLLIGAAANEESFKAEAEDYLILHLATHFLTDDNQPLYSKMVLAQNNQTTEDGYLHTYEIFNLRLNADLVVLSACNTGLGKLRKGEGVIGTSRAFLAAGVPSMVVSLWSVDDKSTADIMKNFYKHLKSGMDKAQALRIAKLDYLEFSGNAGIDPFYWAPFILIGDAAPIDFPTPSSSHSQTVVFTILVIVVAISALIILKVRRARIVQS